MGRKPTLGGRSLEDEITVNATAPSNFSAGADDPVTTAKLARLFDRRSADTFAPLRGANARVARLR